ncbi:very-long-chain (3R)-3-hydroxyacyl-CoA dehydratase 1 isoform X2 [Pan troglodytes]|uniref:very-long-chain (3R)-3-hydroxyacyl-CoA dehydratase 1 isoform X2 n=1 Tax=Pan troglodytes TaxID=9598 RepID=UPI0007DBB893|nr:very-long-chain (3R)-3-hydroxyacyl-CoA dehydratase 1 isoform X2 [Pan troglodytes]XP_054948424.1 very-long-chain (3R)-3-hydroxyacyl-CoA dehydratase 1 isoform X2 [Pan paniscus]
MGRLTEAAAAGSGARAAGWAGSPPTLLPLSPTSPRCAATMASSDEDGTNGGASEAGEDREAPGKRRRLGFLATAWLTFYDIAMTAGWLVLAITMVRFYMEKGTHRGLYKSIQKTLKFFQTFALLEIQNEESVVLFLVAWTVTEITRYSFYTFSLLDHLPYFIKWARYNFFIILYPVGVAGELLTIYAALPYVKKTGMFSIRLPNKYNVSFDYYYFLLITMASYIPLFPQLYFHMLRQRRKVLHGEVIVEKDD